MTYTKYKGPKLKIDLNLAPYMRSHSHGMYKKVRIVLHETISPDIKGLFDISSVAGYLARKDYGIQGMTDVEGHIAWALGLGAGVFWQTGGDNTHSIGIEQISRVPADYSGMLKRYKVWLARKKELDATSKLIACIWRAHKDIAHTFSNGSNPGVTSHWNESQVHPQSEGHTDCWPKHLGGYYPILRVIRKAKVYYALGYHF